MSTTFNPLEPINILSLYTSRIVYIYIYIYIYIIFRISVQSWTLQINLIFVGARVYLHWDFVFDIGKELGISSNYFVLRMPSAAPARFASVSTEQIEKKSINTKILNILRVWILLFPLNCEKTVVLASLSVTVLSITNDIFVYLVIHNSLQAACFSLTVKWVSNFIVQSDA